jgi:uracil-DNA glycosylase
MNQTTLFKYWELLNLVEDYYATGLKAERPNIGVVKFFTFSDSGWDRLRSCIRECGSCGRDSAETERRWLPDAYPADQAPALLVVTDCLSSSSPFPLLPAERDYLSRWLKAIDIDLDSDCRVTSLVKCGSVREDQGFPDAVSRCVGHLRREIDLLKPRALLTLGHMARTVLSAMTLSSPQVHTHHPSTVLADEKLRASVWDEMKRLKAILKK